MDLSKRKDTEAGIQHGDSGGPLVVRSGKKYKLVGVASGGRRLRVKSNKSYDKKVTMLWISLAPNCDFIRT